MSQLTLGVLGRSLKEHEYRLPLHPRHLSRIPDDLQGSVYLEEGYGERFGAWGQHLEKYVGGLASRHELFDRCDVILQPKPMHEDIAALREGQVLWGWPHCVQDPELTQLAIDRRLTLIAFEAMQHWHPDGSFDLHVFHLNNELAGYCSVLHALELLGTTGVYGRPLTAVVIGFGATGRGATTSLNALGIHDVDVLTHRQVPAVADPIHAARLLHYDTRGNSRGGEVVTDDGRVPIGEFLSRHDVIVNCVLQDTDAPLLYLTEDDLPRLQPGTLVVDVSCDRGMGFSWARPTTFADPTFTVGDGVVYYAVDHTPSYLWNSSTWEISEALLPFVRTVLSGPQAWDESATIARAIEIRDGVVQNPAILRFQHRAAEYPHERVGQSAPARG